MDTCVYAVGILDMTDERLVTLAWVDGHLLSTEPINRSCAPDEQQSVVTEESTKRGAREKTGEGGGLSNSASGSSRIPYSQPLTL